MSSKPSSRLTSMTASAHAKLASSSQSSSASPRPKTAATAAPKSNPMTKSVNLAPRPSSSTAPSRGLAPKPASTATKTPSVTAGSSCAKFISNQDQAVHNRKPLVPKQTAPAVRKRPADAQQMSKSMTSSPNGRAPNAANTAASLKPANEPKKGPISAKSHEKAPTSSKEACSSQSKPANPRLKPSKAFLAAHGVKGSSWGQSGASEEAIFVKETNSDGELHPTFIKQARSSGSLNLSAKGLVTIPTRIWTINELDEEERRKVTGNLSLDRVADSEDWWDYVELSKLILASNKISVISPEIGNLKALTILDLHDNAIESIPDEIGQLENLSKLNLSHNNIKRLPQDFYSLKNLNNLNVSNNEIVELGDDVSRLNILEQLDVSHNHLKSLTGFIGYLTKIKSLNLSHNKLKSIPLEIGSMRELTTLDLTRNEIEMLPDSMSDLNKLECLYLRHNMLMQMPNLRLCCNLKEMHLANNQLKLITIDDIENIPNVQILDLRDNKIANLPNEIVNLQALERLDVTNNDLSTLPFSLGTLPHLKSLLVDGNPMKSIRRDIIQRGTVGLMKYLKSRLTQSDLESLRDKGNASPIPTGQTSTDVPDKFAMRTSQSLNLSKKEISQLPREAINNAKETSVTGVDLSKNYFTDIPDGLTEVLPNLYELNMCANRLEKLPGWLGLGTNLQYLNFGNNKLFELPKEISSLPQLREIALPFNKFTEIPPCLYDCPKLETIIMSGNQIVSIDIAGLSKLTSLAVLDLQNNSIQQVPPELGNLRQIKNLQLEGNAFRMPRPQILVKGTEAILAYLRDRIPT